MKKVWLLIFLLLVARTEILRAEVAAPETDPIVSGKPVSEWLKQLLDRDREKREAAGDVLNRISTNVFPALVKMARPKNYPRDPQYEGRLFSEWLYELDSREEKTREAAEKVIKAQGTNLIPILVQMIQIKESHQEEMLHFLTYLPIEYAMNRRFAVVDGFKVLGPLARPAIPDLIKLLSDRELGDPAFLALAKIGPESVSPLLKELVSTNETARRYATEALGYFAEVSEKIVPELIKNLKDPSRDVRSSAISALSQIKKEPKISVPALIERLNDAEPSVRRDAVMAMAIFGKDAEAAIPLLQKIEKEGDPQTRDAAKSAIFEIQHPDFKIE
jgi:HEAT repeat protein